MNRIALPIDSVLAPVIASLRAQSSIVVRAPAGSGKTTRVPPALLDAGLAGAGAIVMLEPRRVAARAAARRIAWERGGRVGDEIGYAVRFDQQIGPSTRIQIVTDGVLLRMLQDDPFLESVAIVVFDEFHERGLNADLALAMVRRVQQQVRADLKIVVMSATLETEPIARFLGDCPILSGGARPHPVQIHFAPYEDPRPIEVRVQESVARAVDETAGDVLAFLPGVGEIRRCAESLAGLAAERDLLVLELYGDLPGDRQDAVLAPAERRKIVLATNVAETSLTIDGVTTVIDSGLARVMRYEPAVGLDRLVLGKISQASADQRAGRAGRTGPGACWRLWTERDHAARASQLEPEVRRVDLAGPVLELHCWGESDPRAFPWFEAPPAAALDDAEQLLERLEAVAGGQVTTLGQRMARLPVHPRIARLLIEGDRLGAAGPAATAAALLAERDPFVRERRGRPASGLAESRRRSSSDLLDRALALEEFTRSGRVQSHAGALSPPAARYTIRVRDQLLKLLDESRPGGRSSGPGGRDQDGALLRAVFHAFADRLARRRESGSRGGVLRDGRGVRLAESSAVMDPPLFVCVEIDAGKSESLVRVASGVERDWLPADRLETRDEVAWDDRQERVLAVRRTRWDGLVLEESPITIGRDADTAGIVAEAAARNLDRVIPKDGGALASFRSRVACLREWMPELGLPAMDDDALRRALPEICRGCRSFDDVRRAPWLDHLLGSLSYPQRQALEREAPERLQVPSGSRVAVRYEAGSRPVLAVRIQELFGLADTPRVAGGRVAVLLHLLAPNMRPQQVTDDLRSFWTNTYPKIRSELRRRYPKHAWPEDPWTAEPERRPKRKRRG